MNSLAAVVSALRDVILQVLHQYVELRREIQSLFVLTSWGRLVHAGFLDELQIVTRYRVPGM